MFIRASRRQHVSRKDGHIVTGSTFAGTPYQIALSYTAVGHGASAKICKGRMMGSEPLVVAVKVFPGLFDPVTEALLVRELRFARDVSLRHPRILTFLGTADVGGRAAIVSLYMEDGNLMEYIKSHARCDKKKLIVQVAEAVDFLHRTARLVHGDLKCTNILISKQGDALLADFGLSTFAEKSLSATSTMTAIRQMNTLQFAAPELFLGEGAATLSKTCESDVYAFGMLVLEALSEGLPWPNQSSLSVMRKVCSGEQPARPMIRGAFVSISHSWWDICQSCWRFKPGDRPRIDDVLGSLRTTEPMRCRELAFQEHMTSALYTPDENAIVAASAEDSIMLFDLATGDIRELWLGGEDSGSDYEVGLAVSPDGRWIACSVGKAVLVFDAKSGLLGTTMANDAFLACVAYSPDGNRIASGGEDCTVRLWDVAAGAAVGTRLEGHSDVVSSVSFSSDGTRVASGSYDGTIRLWDTTTGATTTTLVLPGDPVSVYAIDLSPDGIHIASACDNSMVLVWDLREKRPMRLSSPSAYEVWCVAFSPCGSYIASGSEGGAIRIWDVRYRRLVGGPLTGHTWGVRSIAFSPDGRSLVAVAFNGKVRVWDLFE